MKNVFIKILAGAIALSLFAGCGAQAADSGQASENTPSDGDTADSDESGAAGGEAGDVINPGDPIIVSTMNDTEGEILGRMMVLALRNAGYEVTDNTFGYSGTVNGRTALLEDETDIYMDYTGRGLRLIEDVDESLYHAMETSWESVSEFDKDNGLIWMRYAPFNNTDALAVTKEFAEENDVYSMVDFARYVNDGGYVNMLVHSYWVTLTTGLPGMESAYGFKLTEDQYTITSGNTEQMMYEGTSGVNACMLYSSSGLAYYYDFVVLEDPENVSPVYCPCPIIREDRLKNYPGIADVLDEVFESISLEEMVEMNAKVQVEGYSGMDVAREYLLSKNLIRE